MSLHVQAGVLLNAGIEGHEFALLPTRHGRHFVADLPSILFLHHHTERW